MDWLISGGSGFIGSHFISYILEKYPDANVLNLDSLTYAAHPRTVDYLAGLSRSRYHLLKEDITNPVLDKILEPYPLDIIVNFAAESHVDRSILDPNAFLKTNILGTQNLLNIARHRSNPVRFVQVSTDEVYGSLLPEETPFTEKTPLSPNSPYAASKASADLVALASSHTFHQPVLITRCSNNYGPRQFPEKLIPLVIANALENIPIPVYGDGRQVRDWVYVKDHCAGIDLVCQSGKVGEIYNIGANEEWQNRDIITRILDQLGKPHSLMTPVKDRAGHDRRYAINAKKIRTELGWKPQFSFDKALFETVDWYVKNRSWWQEIRDKDYQLYYSANYKNKFFTERVPS